MSALGQKQTLTFRPEDARFTSKADIEVTQTNVRFVPIADTGLCAYGPRRTAEVENA
jgi:hypothetical protein